MSIRLRYFLIGLIFWLLAFSLPRLHGFHLMGGELTYLWSGTVGTYNVYEIKLIIYRNCDSSTPHDASMKLGVYRDSLNPGDPKVHVQTDELILVGTSLIQLSPNPNCNFPTSACVEKGEFNATILLPPNASGYHLIVERCCRNTNIVNIIAPMDAGQTYYSFIPPAIINSSPQISDVSVPYICIGDTITLINNAYDPDGDSLVYNFVTPYTGNLSPFLAAPDPYLDNNPYEFPIPNIVFAPGYFLSNPFGSGGYAYINQLTGLTKYFISTQGFYVAAIEITEYRNGIPISSMRRDLQFIAITCTPNQIPQFNAQSGSGTIFSVGEGQTLCFPVEFYDPDGDSLFLTASGALLNGSIVNPPGTITNASGDSVVTSQFCWTPTCGMARTTPYQFNVTVWDNGCPSKSASEVFSVYVTAGPASQFPSVNIIQMPPGIICQGSTVTFIANPTLGGSAPQFHWSINGVPTGNDSIAFVASGLNDGDIINLTMIANASCLFNDTAIAPPFIVDVDPLQAPVVSITSNPANFLCPQQICLFTSNIVNGGVNPSYQWNINGAPAGTNQPQFTAANPSGVMIVSVSVTPSTGCPAEASNTIIFNIVPYLSPAVILSATMTDTICPGQPVTFSAISSGTGTPPIYNWLLNGINIGNNNDTLVLSNLNDSDKVEVSVTSNYQCLSPVYGISDPLYYFIYPSLTADLTDGPLEICSGSPLGLEMIASGGNTSSYQYNWSEGSSTNSLNIINPTTTGYYFATVTDVCYGSITDSLLINVLPVPEAKFSYDPVNPTIFTPLVHFKDESTDALSWQWDFGDIGSSQEQHPDHYYNSGGIFNVQLVTTNDVGCTDTLIIPLEVQNFITLYIPNSFTPNGDGKNDVFNISGFSTGGHDLKIFNRWGQEIFRSEGKTDSWDGTDDNGTLMPQGIYLYYVTLYDDKSRKPNYGTVTLLR